MILIVDDEPDIRFMMRMIIELAGHEVTEARHGGMGLKSVMDSRPDLVITDVMMPTMGGLNSSRDCGPIQRPRRSRSWS